MRLNEYVKQNSKDSIMEYLVRHIDDVKQDTSGIFMKLSDTVHVFCFPFECIDRMIDQTKNVFWVNWWSLNPRRHFISTELKHMKKDRHDNWITISHIVTGEREIYELNWHSGKFNQNINIKRDVPLNWKLFEDFYNGK